VQFDEPLASKTYNIVLPMGPDASNAYTFPLATETPPGAPLPSGACQRGLQTTGEPEQFDCPEASKA
jgi:hypothetical protein